MFFDLQQADDKPCLIDSTGKIHSYGQIRAACDEVASALKPVAAVAMGEASKDASKRSANDSANASNSARPLILVLCNNSVGSVVCYLAALRCNAVAMLLGDSVDPDLLAEVLSIYQPNYICRPSNDTSTELNEAPLPVNKPLVVEKMSFEIREFSRQALNLHDDLALMLSTSGSTGSPKFVRLSRKNIQANAESIADYLQLDHQEKAITVLPMPYSYGLSVINSHLLVGAQLVVTDHSLMTKEFWALFEQHQVSSLSGVPYTYEMLQRLRIERRQLTHLKTMTQAGGKMSAEMVQHFAELTSAHGIRFFVMYGQTEASARISYVPADKIAQKSGSIGIAIPSGELGIRSEDGSHILEDNREGELVYRGPNVMLGYAEIAADLAAGDTLGGVLSTGDLGRRDEDGFFYITGRLKRIIKMYGNRVNLDDIDKHLRRINVEGVAGGEDNLLQVMVTSESEVDSVKTSLIDTFKFDHRSVHVFHLSTIPRNDAGKIQYAKIFAAAS